LTRLIRKRNLQQHITILETSPHSEIPKHLSAADVFVLPSLSEGLGLVTLEALATGVPVIATRVGGIQDILIDGYNGLLVEPRDAKSLAKAVLRILSDASLKNRITKAGLKTISCIKENEIEGLLSKFILEVDG
jgi:glycosyltransferase involved in cell wall biosynthesis